MERRFFDALLASADDGRGRRQAGLLPVSFAVHSAAVAALVLVPILAPGPMPPPAVDGSILTVPALLVPKPPPPRGRPPRATLAPPRQSVAAPGTMVAPAYVPPASWLDRAVDEGAGGLEAGLPECEGCVPWGVDDGLPGVGPSDPPAVPPKPVVRAGGDIQPPVKLHGVLPEYPHLALQTGLEGLVIIECQVDTDGRVADARVLRGHPLLNDAALAAVRQWRYRPTLLNGTPVSVILTVTVRFNLRR